MVEERDRYKSQILQVKKEFLQTIQDINKQTVNHFHMQQHQIELASRLKKSQEENEHLMQTLKMQRSGTHLSESLQSDLQNKFRDQI